MSLSKLRELVMNREAWYAAINGVAKIWTWLSNWTELPEDPRKKPFTGLTNSQKEIGLNGNYGSCWISGLWLSYFPAYLCFSEFVILRGMCYFYNHEVKNSMAICPRSLKAGGFRVRGLRQLCRAGDVEVMTMSGWKKCWEVILSTPLPLRWSTWTRHNSRTSSPPRELPIAPLILLPAESPKSFNCMVNVFIALVFPLFT